MLEDVVMEYGGAAVSPLEVYADVFKFGEGYIQKNKDDHRQVANPLGYYKAADADHGHYRIMFEDKWFTGGERKAKDFLEENTDRVWTMQNMQRMGPLLWFNSNTEDIYCLDIQKGICHCYSALVHDSIPFATQLMIPQQGKRDCVSFRIFPAYINSYVKNVEKNHSEEEESDMYVAAKKFQRENNAMIVNWTLNAP